MRIGEKVYMFEDGKKIFGFITEIWPADEYHRAGFRADFHYPRHIVRNYEMKQDDIGKFVFYAKK